MYPGFVMGLVGGLAATAHCLGMCGGFSLHLARASQRAPVFVRQLLYVAGKTFTYAFLGALCGAVGSRLGQMGWLPHSQKYVAILAGVVLMLFGLGMVGVRMPSLAHKSLSEKSPVVAPTSCRQAGWKPALRKFSDRLLARKEG
jgi:sulfite exporter TauE/SafE